MGERANIEIERLRNLLRQYDLCHCGEFRRDHNCRSADCEPFTLHTPADPLETIVDGKSTLGQICDSTGGDEVNSPFDRQVGGEHYKSMPIQPAEFTEVNGLSGMESAAVWYLCRHRVKNGREDLEKAIHFCEMLIDLHYVRGKKS